MFKSIVKSKTTTTKDSLSVSDVIETMDVQETE